MKDYKTLKQLCDEFNTTRGIMQNIVNSLDIHKVQFGGKTSAYYYNYQELIFKLDKKGIK